MSSEENQIWMDDGRIVYSPICTYCIHSRDYPSGSCKAFPAPDGIPDEIWNGHNPHVTAVDGDQGIRFEGVSK